MTIKILQIGQENWVDSVTIPKDLDWYFTKIENLSSCLKELKKEKVVKIFNAVLFTSPVQEDLLAPLIDMVEAYGVFFDTDISFLPEDRGFHKQKMTRHLPISASKQEKVVYLHQNLFRGQYGARLKVSDIVISPLFKGRVVYEGNLAVQFSGEFGEDFTPLFTYRYNLTPYPMALEFWQEYIGDAACEIAIEITSFFAGSLHDRDRSIFLKGKDLETPYIMDPQASDGYYSFTVFAKGKGRLQFGSLHWRYSRKGLGQFVLGGQRIVDEQRQELITYFNPGDMKPPLNIYFSGYRQAEGFEGYGVMKKLKSPFMLIGDPRLEGGCFYIGSKDLENKLQNQIQSALDYLDFDSSQVIFSGLSMGAFGALYYASSFSPYAVITGKPFASLGNTVKMMKLKRPDEFETIGDVVRNLTGGTDLSSIEQLSDKFWEKFKTSDFKQTEFALAFMENDDYDATATQELKSYLAPKNVHIYTKGYQGRHNDNSPAINNWLVNQFQSILSEKFGREF